MGNIVVRSLSCVWTAACHASLSFTISQGLLKLMSIESMMLSNHLILCHPLLLPSNFPSIRVFSNELALCIRWPKSRSCSSSISHSNEYSGLMSLRIDWFDLLAVQETLKRVFSNTTVRKHQFFSAQPSFCHFYLIPLSATYFFVISFCETFCGCGLFQQASE